MFHHPQPNPFRFVDQGCRLLEKVRDLLEQRTQIARRSLGFIVAALQFVQQDTEQLFRGIGLERVAAAGVILAFLEQLAAQGQPIEVLLI